MKKNFCSTLIIAAVLAVASCAANLRAAETNNTTPRVGVYDSRAVAYAWFWSANQQKQLNKLMQDARAARASGDMKRFKELDATLVRHQDEMHCEVFSTAPATNALAEIKDRLPEIRKSAGVTTLISKWDDAALKKYPDAEKADVTGALVRAFITPTPQQQKVLSGIITAAPLPPEQCEELIRKGAI